MVRLLKNRLRQYGYGLSETKDFDAETKVVVTAFQRHFRQKRIDGVADLSTVQTLDSLVRSLRPRGFGIS
jgi:N-acetylmuramoyl-L-alanine amidase